MGWLARHLHEFEIVGRDVAFPVRTSTSVSCYAPSSACTWRPSSAEPSRFATSMISATTREHRIKLERRLPPDPLSHSALSVAGPNACPLEDVGGAPGYADFVEAMTDPEHLQRHDSFEWHGWESDPTAFDFVAINLRLRSIKR